MTSQYVKCDTCENVVDRRPKDDHRWDGTFGKLGGGEARRHAQSIGWKFEGGKDICPDCQREAVKRQFDVQKLFNDPLEAAIFLSAFIRQQYGWDEDTDPEQPSTITDGPLDIARNIAAVWVKK